MVDVEDDVAFAAFAAGRPAFLAQVDAVIVGASAGQLHVIAMA